MVLELMMIIMVNFLTKAPKEGFMMHPETWVDSRFQNVWGHYIQTMQVPAFEGPLVLRREAVQKLMGY